MSSGIVIPVRSVELNSDFLKNGSVMNILDVKIEFMRSKITKLSRKIKGNSTNHSDFVYNLNSC